MRRVIILGAAGRDFHNFLTVFKDDPHHRVVCFTAAQIPGIANRTFPSELAGSRYPRGIPIHDERELPRLIAKYRADEIVLAYSDLSNQEVMNKASIALAAGAGFRLLGRETMLTAKKPVIAVCAARTGSGKSPTTRYLARRLARKGRRVIVIRHPMPYRDLRTQRAERFGSVKDLSPCTIEEREEFEPLVEQGVVVYAGVDYQEILGRAQREADILLWDGGNNDLPFLVPDVHVVLVDPHRPGNELSHYPGQANVRMADIIVVSKVNTALPEAVKAVIRNVKTVNPQADVVKAGLAITVHTTLPLAGKRVLVVEDGPTLTHGNMPFGAGLLAARQRNARALDPRRYAVGSIRGVYQAYPALGPVLPAIGYSLRQIRELERTINRVPCDYVLDATPANLQRILRVNKPVINITYELEDYGNALWKAVERRLRAEKKQ